MPTALHIESYIYIYIYIYTLIELHSTNDNISQYSLLTVQCTDMSTDNATVCQ